MQSCSIITIISLCCLLQGFVIDGFYVVSDPGAVYSYPRLPNEVNVTCLFDHRDKENVARVTKISLTYIPANKTAEQLHLATFGLHDYSSKAPGIWSSGEIKDGVAGSHATVVLWNLQDNITEISCKAWGNTPNGSQWYDTKSTYILTKPVDVNPTYEDAMMALQALKNKTKYLKSQLEAIRFLHDAFLQNNQDVIHADVMARNLNTSDWQKKLEQQEKTLLAMEKREKTTVHFIATPDSEDDKYDGKEERVVYSNVTVNRGQGYDSRTGIFKAPVGGYYLFRYSVFVKPNTFVYISLRNEKFQTMDTILGGARDKWERYSDGSRVVYLKAGQEAFLSPGKSKGYSFDTRGDWYSNRFEGYLLKATDYQPQSSGTYTIHSK